MLRRIAGTVLLVLLVTACTPEQMSWWATAPPDQRDSATEAIVRSAAEEYGVDPELMLSIQRCEGGVPWSRNRHSSASGLFQHLLPLWSARAAAVGEPDAPWWDPVTNSRAAALMIADGGTSPWNASRRCWR